MFARGISILTGSAMDPGNIPPPRPSDARADRCAQAALRALQAEPELMSPLDRMRDPERYARIQLRRREQLESFLWVDSNEQILERIVDLVLTICEEPNWSASGAYVEDPARPSIDFQAAETGMLLAWVHHRHGARLKELCPRLQRVMLDALRRRLLVPVVAHEDYPFMQGKAGRSALILSDLLLSCLLMENNPARRQQPVKRLLQLLDRATLTMPSGATAYADRLCDACALADLARLLKRLTRGELDFTRESPAQNRLDDLFIPWISGDYFLDPGGEGLRPEISGLDIFRLGYLTRSKPLSALGAQLSHYADRSAVSISGRMLSMEYLHALQDEMSLPPRLRRAHSEDGTLMVSRMDGMLAAISCAGSRANAGDITLFADSTPVLGDIGGAVHSLPLLDGQAPLLRPRMPLATDADFGADRELMSVDLTDAYPEQSGMAAYQRTLMTMRSDGTVRLVDAFEFIRPPQELIFCFTCLQKPLSLRESVRIGPVSLTWDGSMMPEIAELPDGGYLLSFTLREVPRRLICGFSFERS